MSKIGKMPITIPDGVTVTVAGQKVEVKGPKGNLSYEVPTQVSISQSENTIALSISDDQYKNFWGLARTLISNMIEGVTKGYEKKLLILGVGFNAKLEGKNLVLQLGFSHPVNYPIPEGINIQVDKDPKGNPLLIIEGIDKQLVGETTAKIRDFKRPEPYKGKGIRYLGEVVKMKAGKSAKK